MSDSNLKVKRRSDDGNRVFSIRVSEDILKALDKLATETNRSRNELINIILRYGIENIEIE